MLSVNLHMRNKKYCVDTVLCSDLNSYIPCHNVITYCEGYCKRNLQYPSLDLPDLYLALVTMDIEWYAFINTKQRFNDLLLNFTKNHTYCFLLTDIAF